MERKVASAGSRAQLWLKALRIIPSVTKEEWNKLDFLARWLIASRAAVLVMTFISGVLAGLFALREGVFKPGSWLLLIGGLVLAHATNNLFNDFMDFSRGVDQDNYFRTLYGPHPLAHGLLSKRQLLTYAGLTGAVAAVMGIGLIAVNAWDPFIWLLLGLGVFFVLFYTWPLKYLALGELAVLVVWGPLMIAGGHYVLTHHWSWWVALASAPYALNVTTVIFGKHIDKIEVDRGKGIHTLPVLIGERPARLTIIASILLSYAIVLGLIAARFFTPVLLLVLLAIPSLRRVFPSLLKPRPKTRPESFPEGQGGWPLYFAPLAFVNNRSFGFWFILGLIADTALRLLLPSFWR
jgi:1,4-dihydroxy-2-naphthoate octaprenyltransferase